MDKILLKQILIDNQQPEITNNRTNWSQMTE